jgi:hypothetical protein
MLFGSDKSRLGRGDHLVAFRLLCVAAVIPAANILFFFFVLLLGLNSDEHRKYGASIVKDNVSVSLQRLENRAAEANAVRDFKSEFSDILKIHDGGRVPSSEKARLLQEQFVRPIRECLVYAYAASDGNASSDGSDPFSQVIAHLLRETEAVLDTTRQSFLIAAQRGKVYWNSCREFVPEMKPLVRNFHTWEDLVDNDKRRVFQQRLKAVVERLQWDDLYLTGDRAPGSRRGDIHRAYEAIENLKAEVNGKCLNASLEGASLEGLTEQCHRARENLVRTAKELSTFVVGTADTFEQFQEGDRKTAEELFGFYMWKIFAYFLVIWLANVVFTRLSMRWKMAGGHEHPPEGLGPESGAPPRPSPIPGH